MAHWVNLSFLRGSKESRKMIKCTAEQTVGDILSNEFDQGERISKVVGAVSDHYKYYYKGGHHLFLPSTDSRARSRPIGLAVPKPPSLDRKNPPDTHPVIYKIMKMTGHRLWIPNLKIKKLGDDQKERRQERRGVKEVAVEEAMTEVIDERIPVMPAVSFKYSRRSQASVPSVKLPNPYYKFPCLGCT
ncbi:hypothetical protein CAPTEDRAFT_195186 [Capitella teleta]|uniref:Uncharacterized protein n=1 Tax=Capitella teleta TaxID=283909 RepID=R7U5V8_CAPTE|nr:hypothetical protein CAPTEDRAFT_195186 [Capitella teleta]|eukprot:ELU01755.1 hypothetical protein CAPTEDRAFT_195186 [Capitella teleta]